MASAGWWHCSHHGCSSWKAWLTFPQRLQSQVCSVDLANNLANKNFCRYIVAVMAADRSAGCWKRAQGLPRKMARLKEAQRHLAFAILSMQLRTPSPAAVCRLGTSSCHTLQHNSLEGGLCCRSSLLPGVLSRARMWTAPCYQAMCTRQGLPLRKAQAAGQALTQMLGVIDSCADVV